MTGNLLDVFHAVTAAEQFNEQVGIFRNIFQAGRRAFEAIKVRADADAIDTGNLADVIDVVGHFTERGRRAFGMGFAPFGVAGVHGGKVVGI